MSIKIIAAVSLNGVIGKVEKIPDPIDIDVKYEMRKAQLKLIFREEFDTNNFPELANGSEPQFIDQYILPWPMDKYPEDMKWFRSQTANSTIIMGRKTFDSIGKALPKRRNIVISRSQFQIAKRDVPGIEWTRSLQEALELANKDEKVWIIGGSSIYQKALALDNLDEIYLTTIPEFIIGDRLIYLPYINHRQFKLNNTVELCAEKKLYCDVFKRI